MVSFHHVQCHSLPWTDMPVKIKTTSLKEWGLCPPGWHRKYLPLCFTNQISVKDVVRVVSLVCLRAVLFLDQGTEKCKNVIGSSLSYCIFSAVCNAVKADYPKPCAWQKAFSWTTTFLRWEPCTLKHPACITVQLGLETHKQCNIMHFDTHSQLTAVF